MTSKQSIYYCANKSKVLAYKKEYYKKKNEKYMIFKPILIAGLIKHQSNTLIKTVIVLNKLVIAINNKTNYTLSEFMKKKLLEKAA